jgi:AcrR family transcriptional regulator
VEEVARRAGVSKGLLYLYFKTKEELFKAVIRSVVTPRVDELTRTLDSSDLGAEAFIRGPLLAFMQRKHPDLVDYYWDNVASRGLGALRQLLERGVANGEFRRSAVNELPQLFVAPVMMSIVWGIVFADRSLDTDKLIETHIDMILTYIRA